MGIRISGTGSWVPERILTNADLEKMVDTSDEWIVTRTGIRVRHIADETMATSDLAYRAAKLALENAKLTPDMIDLIVVSTITPDKPTPSVATMVQSKLGVPVSCMCFDIEAACAGLLYGINIVHALLASGQRKRAIVIGADKLSSVTNWQDRSTCVLFGDGASALVIESDPAADDDFLVGTSLGADGTQAGILQIRGGGSAVPITEENLKEQPHTITMNGPKTFQQAVTRMTSACRDVLEKTGTAPDSIRWAIAHQANDRIISAVADRLNMHEQVYRNVERYGNTSSASVGICIDELNRGGKLKKGDLILTAAFGAGLIWASEILKWQ